MRIAPLTVDLFANFRPRADASALSEVAQRQPIFSVDRSGSAVALVPANAPAAALTSAAGQKLFAYIDALVAEIDSRGKSHLQRIHVPSDDEAMNISMLMSTVNDAAVSQQVLGEWQASGIDGSTVGPVILGMIAQPTPRAAVISGRDMFLSPDLARSISGMPAPGSGASLTMDGVNSLYTLVHEGEHTISPLRYLEDDTAYDRYHWIEEAVASFAAGHPGSVNAFTDRLGLELPIDSWMYQPIPYADYMESLRSYLGAAGMDTSDTSQTPSAVAFLQAGHPDQLAQKLAQRIHAQHPDISIGRQELTEAILDTAGSVHETKQLLGRLGVLPDGDLSVPIQNS